MRVTDFTILYRFLKCFDAQSGPSQLSLSTARSTRRCVGCVTLEDMDAALAREEGLCQERLSVGCGCYYGSGGDADCEPFGGALEAYEKCSAVRGGGCGVSFVQQRSGSCFLV